MHTYSFSGCLGSKELHSDQTPRERDRMIAQSVSQVQYGGGNEELILRSTEREIGQI